MKFSSLSALATHLPLPLYICPQRMSWISVHCFKWTSEGWVGWRCDLVTVTSSVSRRTRRKRRRTRRTRRCILTSQDEHQGEEDAAVRARRQPWHPDHTKGHQGKSTWNEKDKRIMGQLAELEVAEFWFCVVQVLNITIFAVLYLIVFAGDI